MTFTEANGRLQGRNAESRKIQNNTYLIRKDHDTIAVKLHHTDVVTLKSNGNVILDSGGWRTVTTKQRMNEYIPQGFRIWSDKGVWYLGSGQWGSPNRRQWAYEDGITIHSDGTVSGEGEDPQRLLKLKRQVNHYVAAFMTAMENGKVPAPNAGDCFYCQMREVETKRPLGEIWSDHDHILSHMEEKYFVPSLLARALEVMPKSQVMMWWVCSFWDLTASGDQRLSARRAGGDFAKQQVAKVLKRYILRQLGMQA